MVLVRMVWQAQLGHAGEVVAAMKKSEPVYRDIIGPDFNVRLLTDLSGNFDTVVQEMRVESLAAWEARRAQIFADPRFRELMAGMPQGLVSGRQEYYTIELDA